MVELDLAGGCVSGSRSIYASYLDIRPAIWFFLSCELQSEGWGVGEEDEAVARIVMASEDALELRGCDCGLVCSWLSWVDGLRSR